MVRTPPATGPAGAAERRRGPATRSGTGDQAGEARSVLRPAADPQGIAARVVPTRRGVLPLGGRRGGPFEAEAKASGTADRMARTGCFGTPGGGALAPGMRKRSRTRAPGWKAAMRTSRGRATDRGASRERRNIRPRGESQPFHPGLGRCQRKPAAASHWPPATAQAEAGRNGRTEGDPGGRHRHRERCGNVLSAAGETGFRRRKRPGSRGPRAGSGLRRSRSPNQRPVRVADAA